ncbi:MAG: pyroglutamyl-peptidase I [Pseudomonadota bacterium]
MANILISGFGDWAGSSANPSKALADALDETSINDSTISSVIAPVTFGKMINVVTDKIDSTSPDIVIMLGEYCGRTMITVERLAQNFIDATRYDSSDDSGAQPQGVPIASDGPAAYYATLPLRAMVKAMRENGIPSDISDTAGTFGCNLLMYGVLHHIAKHQLPIRAGWVHLPSLPATAALDVNLGMASMSIETQLCGLKAAIAAAIENQEDIHEPIRSSWQ